MLPLHTLNPGPLFLVALFAFRDKIFRPAVPAFAYRDNVMDLHVGHPKPPKAFLASELVAFKDLPADCVP